MSQSWASTAWEPRWYKVSQTTTVTRLDKLTTFSKVIVCWLKLQLSHSVLEAGETMLTSECIANTSTHYRQLTLDGANPENVERKKMSKCSLPSVSETRSLLPTQLPSKQTIKCLCRVPAVLKSCCTPNVTWYNRYQCPLPVQVYSCACLSTSITGKGGNIWTVLYPVSGENFLWFYLLTDSFSMQLLLHGTTFCVSVREG